MNENPEGTPNPLNPNPAPGVQPDLAGPAPVQDPMLAPRPQPMPNLAPTPEPIIAPEPATTPEPMQNLAAEPQPMPEPMPVEPVAQPMNSEPMQPMGSEPMQPMATAPEQPTLQSPDSIVEPAKGKKKKKVWIVVAIIAILAAIGCAVAALLILNPFKQDNAVDTAIVKLLKGETPKNIALTGKLTGVSDDENSDLVAIEANFDAKLATAYGTGTTTASLTLAFPDDIEITLDVEEAMVADGDIYFKIDGFTESFKSLIYAQLDCNVDAENTDCPEVDLTEIDMSTVLGEFGEIFNIVETIEGNWIQIPAKYISGEESFLSFDETTQCLIDAVSGIGQNGNGLAEIYEQNPFITASTENLKIAAKADTLYRLGVDEVKLDSFMSAASNSAFAKSLTACTGEIDASDAKKMLADLPTVYVEVNANNEFTRVYVNATSTDGLNTITTDFSVSYPATIEVIEPAEYTDFETLVMSLFGMYTNLSNGSVLEETI